MNTPSIDFPTGHECPSLLQTRITADLGLDVPIISAGMAFVAGPELVAAVSSAGGLGTLEHMPSQRSPGPSSGGYSAFSAAPHNTSISRGNNRPRSEQRLASTHEPRSEVRSREDSWLSEPET